MRAIDLNWKVTEHTGKPQRDMRKGTTLYQAYLGKWSRFCIQEIYQGISAHGYFMPTLFVLKDADRVTDAQVRIGNPSPIIARSEDAQQLVDYALSLERLDARR